MARSWGPANSYFAQNIQLCQFIARTFLAWICLLNLGEWKKIPKFVLSWQAPLMAAVNATFVENSVNKKLTILTAPKNPQLVVCS